jgi:Arc/MetJ family transcription regulator
MNERVTIDDDALVEEAQRIGGHATKEAAVTEALEDYIARSG